MTLFGGRIEFKPATESALVLLVILAGALGAYVHTATSFSTHLGLHQFDRAWHWWYLLRLPIGSALALLLYFALRGGLVGTDATSADVNPYGVAALSALAGLFSKQAIEKLGEVFDTFFRTRAQEQEQDRLKTPIPELETVEPKVFSTLKEQELKLVGRGFDEETSVLIKAATADAPLHLRTDKASVAETELVVRIGAGEIAPGEYIVIVVNGAPGWRHLNGPAAHRSALMSRHRFLSCWRNPPQPGRHARPRNSASRSRMSRDTAPVFAPAGGSPQARREPSRLAFAAEHRAGSVRRLRSVDLFFYFGLGRPRRSSRATCGSWSEA